MRDKVISILQHGRDKAIRGSEIAHRLGCKNDRQVRLAIRALIAEGYPIASTTESPFGYFIVTDKQEAEVYAQTLRSRLIEDATRRRDFLRSAGRHLEKVTQGKLI
ncbi:MAG: hypothetical protein CMI54_02810 [Parcubacteria group bacterium]|nr:hypothetical protein [Parcubacteria group bacterium]|tara:strand:+ start:4878 stop:5195 length:318 start_codon:yes stop_codon:yes gene_type:complete